MRKIRHKKSLNRKRRILNITGSNCRTASKEWGMLRAARPVTLIILKKLTLIFKKVN